MGVRSCGEVELCRCAVQLEFTLQDAEEREAAPVLTARGRSEPSKYCTSWDSQCRIVDTLVQHLG